ncbi:MAG: hypothetical protein ABIJ56_18265 [Pseudomonadota bacterium]
MPHCKHIRPGAGAAAVGIFIAILSIADSSSAQSYNFRVAEATVTVEIFKDGSVEIDYELLFENIGMPIDVVDIGMPTEDYDLSTCSAALDGEPLSDIRKSEYIDTGIEVHLDRPISSARFMDDVIEKALPDGYGLKGGKKKDRGRALFTASCVNRNMIYQDTTDEAYASFRFTPTWFGPELVSGTTNMQIRFIMPGTAKKDEIKWHDEPFDMVGEYENTGRAMAVWNRPVYEMTGPRLFGLSFPKRLVDKVITVTVFGLAWTWFKNSAGARIVLGGAAMLLFSIGFFLITNKTGCTLWALLAAGLGFLLYGFPASNIVILPVSIAALVIGIRVQRGKKGHDYIRAVVSVPGGGVKRGLTAVEAAALLGLPAPKVLTIMFFGMVKKGLAKIIAEKPFAVQLAGGTFQAAIDIAKAKHIPLRAYEKEAMLEIDAAADETGAAKLAQVKLDTTIEKLRRNVADKVTGFDIDGTKAYYDKITKRAWSEARRGIASLRPEIFDASLDWMMLDPDFKQQWEGIDLGPGYSPVWLGRGFAVPPGSGGLTGGGLDGTVGGGAGVPDVSVLDVTKSIAGKFETIGKSLVDSVGFPGLESKGIDLSGLDKLTSDILTSARSGGGGGGGSGCACACAGCACACACAGGGR